MRYISIVLAGSVAAFASSTAFAEPRQHFTVTAAPATAKLPRKVLVLPLDVTVYRVGAGGVTERAEDLTNDERTDTEQMLRDQIAKEKGLELITLSPLDNVAEAQLDEHVALYHQVAGAALQHAHTWPQKVGRFDYTLGDGLRFLKQRTGADAALIVYGEGGVPTTSSYVAGLLTIVVGVVSVPQAQARAVVGFVDLETGNLLWLDSAVQPGGVRNAVERAVRNYPVTATSPSGN